MNYDDWKLATPTDDCVCRDCQEPTLDCAILCPKCEELEEWYNEQS